MATLANFDVLGVTLASALGFANSACAALRNHFANTIGACFGFGLRDHLASCVVANLAAVFANHTASLVTHFFCAALRNHLASGVIANLGPIFANHAAHFVRNLFRFTLRYHSAHGVIASFCSALWNHLAHSVSASFCSALRYYSTDGVRNLTGTALAAIPCAANLFLLTGWHPTFLADSFRWALNALGVAFSRCVNTFAGTRVVRPCPWLAYGFPHYRPGDSFSLCFPMAAFDRYGAGVLFGNAHTVLLGSHFLFANGVVDSVIFLPCFRFINRLADCVLDCSGLGLVNRLANSVVNGFRTSFVHRFFYCVVDRTLMSLVNRLTNGVFDGLFASLVDWATNRVVDCLLVLFVNRFTNGVIGRACPCFVGGDHHCVIDVPRGCLWDKSTALNLTVLVVDFISCAITSFFDLVVNRFAYGAHASVSSTSDRGGGFFITASGYSASTTALVADCAAVCSASGICTGHDRADHDGGYDPQPIHLNFSTGNNTSVARRSIGESGASALIPRHRSPCFHRMS